ncbi:MAG: RNA-processing protein [Methanomassiliicoccales archaeon]|nr:MAG: RNA-processing protein [Methanomassiliicoccales archaeon]
MKYVKIPMERVGVLVGKNGEIKKKIEDETGTTLLIDSKTGDVTVDDSKASDPILILKCADMVKAIGRGFSPKKALRLLDDDIYFTLLDIRDYAGKNQKHVRRVRSRIIGTKGKTRILIEELTGVNVSIYGNTVGVIGESLEMGIAVTAIEMLLSGSEHSAVYSFLEKKKRDMKLAEIRL